MAIPGFALIAGMLLLFPKSQEIWDPPRPASTRPLPGIKPGASEIGGLKSIVRDDIRDGRRNGDLSRKDAKAFRREAAYIDRLERRYARDGLSDSEITELRNRLGILRSMIYARGVRSTGAP